MGPPGSDFMGKSVDFSDPLTMGHTFEVMLEKSTHFPIKSYPVDTYQILWGILVFFAI